MKFEPSTWLWTILLTTVLWLVSVAMDLISVHVFGREQDVMFYMTFYGGMLILAFIEAVTGLVAAIMKLIVHLKIGRID